MAPTVGMVTLQANTLLAFSEYIREAERAMKATLEPGAPFLWCSGSADRLRRLSHGEVLAELWSGSEPVEAPEGLIHDWIGAALIPRGTIAKTLAVMQDYDNHKITYRPDVIDSKLISRQGNDFQIYLRLLKKKIVTAVLDTLHQVRYEQVSGSCWYCRSSTTRIAEVEDAGQASEITLPADTGHGYLWRLNSYWKLQETEGATVVECRAISLTRNIPLGLKWVIRPIIRSLPKESLINTLAATRQAVANLPASESAKG